MRRVVLLDRLTGAVKTTITWPGQEITIQDKGRRAKAWEKGLQCAGRLIAPRHGEIFLDAILETYARSSYVSAVELKEG